MLVPIFCWRNPSSYLFRAVTLERLVATDSGLQKVYRGNKAGKSAWTFLSGAPTFENVAGRECPSEPILLTEKNLPQTKCLGAMHRERIAKLLFQGQSLRVLRCGFLLPG